MAQKTKPTRPPTYGPVQFATRIGLERWQAEAARERDLFPGPDLNSERWSEALAIQVAAQVPAIVKVVGAEHPIGASRAAAQISERSGLEVTWSDVRAIADARPELLPVVVADRLRWTAGSKTREETAAALGVTVRELRKMPLERGPLGRYDTEQVRALAADETAAATAAEVIADRRLGPD